MKIYELSYCEPYGINAPHKDCDGSKHFAKREDAFLEFFTLKAKYDEYCSVFKKQYWHLEVEELEIEFNKEIFIRLLNHEGGYVSKRKTLLEATSET